MKNTPLTRTRTHINPKRTFKILGIKRVRMAHFSGVYYME